MPTNAGQPIGIQGNIQNRIVQNRVLEVLRNKTIGTFATATNRADSDARVDLFYKVSIAQSEAYDFSDRNKEPDLMKVDQIELHKDIQRIYRIEDEDFDRFDIGTDTFNQIVARIGGSVGLGIATEIDAEIIKASYNQCVATGATAYTINAKYSQPDTPAELQLMWKQSVRTVNSLIGQIDRTMLGANKEEVILFTDLNAKAEFISYGKGGDANFGAQQSGQFTQINGVSITDNVLIGKNLPQGDTFSKDNSYDFSNLEALFLHTEAVALGFNLVSQVKTISQNSGNSIYITKYRMGLKVLYPNLIRMIVKATPTPLTFTKGIRESVVLADEPSADKVSDIVANLKPLTKQEKKELKNYNKMKEEKQKEQIKT